MLVSINEVSKYFGEKLILENVSATIEDNDRIGLIGANGTGKSTLLNMICRLLEYDTGTIDYSNDMKIGFLKQNTGLNKNNSIYCEMRSVFSDLLDLEQDLHRMEAEMATVDHHTEAYQKLMEEYAKQSTYFEHSGGYEIDLKIKTILTGMGFSDKSYDFIISALSGGEKTRLALAKLLLEQPTLLILDEPTNHLDFKTLNWLEGYLQDYKGGLLIVSHDRYFLDKMVTKIWDVEAKSICTYKGNYSKYKVLRMERNKAQQKEYDKQQIQISSMQEYVEKNIARASTSNSAKSRLHKLDAMTIIEKPIEYVKPPYFHFEYDRAPVKDVLFVDRMKLRVGVGDSKITLFENIQLDIKRGEKVAIIGENGVGKSTLLKSLIGMIRQQGEIEWGRNVTIGYYDQENQTLDPNKTVLNELWNRFPTMPEFQVRKILGGMLISDDNVYKQIKVISGGEKAKVGFAILMTEHKNTLVFDEPTNHLDLQSKEALEEALQAFDGTLLFVSHDRYFLNTIPTKIIEMVAEKGKPETQAINIYKGNYDFYVEQKAVEQAKSAEMPKPVTPAEAEDAPKSYFRSKEQRREETKRRTRLKQLESEIEELDFLLTETEQALSDPEHGDDYDLLSQKCVELEEYRKQHETAMEEWLILSELQEE